VFELAEDSRPEILILATPRLAGRQVRIADEQETLDFADVSHWPPPMHVHGSPAGMPAGRRRDCCRADMNAPSPRPGPPAPLRRRRFRPPRTPWHSLPPPDATTRR